MKKICLALTFVVMAAGMVAAQKTFYNKEYKVGFKYPATLKIAKSQADPEEGFKNLTEAIVIHPGRHIFGATATLAAGKVTREACKAMPQASEEEKARPKRFGATTFYKVSELDGGMESVQQFEFYRTFQNNTCYQITLQVGMAKNTRGPVDEKSAFAKLYNVLSTMYFR